MADEGIICCIDILGYQNIINTNQIEYVSNLISDTISTIPKNVQEIVGNYFKDAVVGTDHLKESVEAVDFLNKKIKYLSISDTILVSLSMKDFAKPSGFEETTIATVEMTAWILYLVNIATLQRIYFDAGLPVRGAIAYGEFYISENNFAGKPIIDSYVQAQKLNFSGCALTVQCGELMLAKIAKWSDLLQNDTFKMFDGLLVPYSAPLKGSSYKRLLLVDWLNNSVKNASDIPQDIGQYINTAFHDHNKEIDDTVISKIENTERILRWMKEKKWKLTKDSLEQHSA